MAQPSRTFWRGCMGWAEGTWALLFAMKAPLPLDNSLPQSTIKEWNIPGKWFCFFIFHPALSPIHVRAGIRNPVSYVRKLWAPKASGGYPGPQHKDKSPDLQLQSSALSGPAPCPGHRGPRSKPQREEGARVSVLRTGHKAGTSCAPAITRHLPASLQAAYPSPRGQ